MLAHRASRSARASRRSAFPTCFSVAAAAALFVAVLGTLLKYTENATYLLYLLSRHDLDLGILAPRSGRNGTSASTASPQYLAEVARDSDAEEIVIVGHSSGSFLGAEILARALKLDPALGRHGPRVVLLTIGGNFPIVGFHKPCRRISAIICGSWRSSLRSTGSTARRART